MSLEMSGGGVREQAANMELAENTRKFVSFVIDRGIKDYSELNPNSTENKDLGESEEARANAIFRRVARRAIDRLVVHGVVREIDNRFELQNVSDSDGEGFVAMCKMAGLGYSRWTDEKGKERQKLNLEYVYPGESPGRAGYIREEVGQGMLVGDTGGRDVEVDMEKGIFYNDHHSEASKPNSSATKQAYEIFTEAGLIERSPELDKTVEFITRMDNGNYPGMHDMENFVKSYGTMIGLSRFLNFAEIRYFFSVPDRNPLAFLDDKLLDRWSSGKSVSMRERMRHEKEVVEEALRGVDNLKEEGYTMQTEGYGQVLIDIDGKLPKGRDTAYAKGFTTFVSWSPEKNSFAIFSKNKIEVSFDQGFMVREHMWIKPKNKGGELTVSLRDILMKLGNGKLEMGKGLSDYVGSAEDESESNWLDDFITMEEILGEPERQDLNSKTDEIDEEELLEIEDKVEEMENVVLEPSSEREEEIENVSSVDGVVTELDQNEGLAKQEEERLRQYKVVQELRAEWIADEERKITLSNIFSGRFWRRAWDDTKKWWKKFIG